METLSRFSGWGINLGQSVIVRTCRVRPQLKTGLSLDHELSLPRTWCLSIPSATSSSLSLLLSPCSAADWAFQHVSYRAEPTHTQFSVLLWGFYPHQAAHPKALLTNTSTGAAPARQASAAPSAPATTPGHCHHPRALPPP